MNGPEHYRKAEALLQAALVPDRELNGATRGFAVAQAQVHATLALTAATVAARIIGPETLSGARHLPVDDEGGHWAEATR